MKYILLIFIWTAVHHSVQTQYYKEQEAAINYLQFALNSYRTIQDTRKNFVNSPLSLNVIYNILYQISSGDAETRLQETLLPINRIRPAKYDILQGQVDTLDQITRNRNVRLTTKFYLNNSTEFDTRFKYLAERYQTTSESINFNDTEKSKIIINQWVESRTNSQVVNLVEDGQIKSDTQMIIINTLYFRAEWLRPFSSDHIHDGIFNAIHGNTTAVKFIEDTQSYDISLRPALGLYALRLPYKSGYEFWIILPFSNYLLENVIQSLTVDVARDIQLNFYRTHSKIKFPIFTVENRVDGKNFKPDAFRSSNFHFKVDIQNSVGDIIQKVKFMVDIGGTEAGLGISTTRMPVNASRSLVLPEPFSFIADRPFVYAVVADGNLPIIIGHYIS